MTPKQTRVMVLNDMEKLDRTLFRLDQGKFQVTFNSFCFVQRHDRSSVFIVVIMATSLLRAERLCLFIDSGFLRSQLY